MKKNESKLPNCEKKEFQEKEKEHAGGAIVKQVIAENFSLSEKKKTKVCKLRSFH